MVKGNEKRDIEEDDEYFQSSEGDPINFWEQKQKELVSSTVDFNLTTLADLCQSKTINLDPKFQRRFRWDKSRQSKLIESFLMNVPVPPIFLNEDQYGAYSVIDGKQRLLAISSFMHNDLRLEGLEVFTDINGKTIEELPEPLKTVIRTRPTLRTIIVLHHSDEDVKFEVFRRLNTGGVQLNFQEIRNSTYPGSLNDMILDLSTNGKFHQMLGIRKMQSSRIYQEMRDAEFVLRYLTFRDSWNSFSGSMNRRMDHFMADNKDIPSHEIDDMRKDFLQTLESVDAAFGIHAFRRWLPDKTRWQERIVASLYDAEMFACRRFDRDTLLARKPDLVEGLKGLFSNEEFQSSLRSLNPARFKQRVDLVVQMIESGISG
jgi:hypothetical protein